MEDDRLTKLRHYLEEWGMLFEQLGSTRAIGRILGWLLVCTPPEQTAKDIAKATGMSIASVSAATRILVQAGMIERKGVPGERSAYLRVRPGVWGQIFRRRMAHTQTMRALAEEGLSLISPADDRSTLRLREIGSYCAFFEREFPRLLERWEEEWKRQIS